MKLPADGVVINAKDVKTKEAELTGEPDEIPKVQITQENSQEEIISGVVMAKTLVSSGTGTAVVIAVGKNTAAGAIDKDSPTNEETDLQKKLAIIATKIGNVGIAAAVLTFVSMIIRLVLEGVKVLPCGCGNIMSCVAEDSCLPLFGD